MKNLGSLYVVFSAAGFATLPIFGKVVMELGMHRDLALFWRFLIATPFLFLWSRLQEGPVRLNFQKVLSAFFLGFIAIGVEASLFFIAVKELGAALSNVIFYTYPAFTALFMRIFYQEKLPAKKTLALILCLIFLLFMIDFSAARLNVYGLSVAAIMAIWYALYMVVGGRMTRGLPAVWTSAMVSAGAGFAFLLLSLRNDFRVPNSSEWIWVLGLAIASTVVPFGFLFLGLKKIGSSQTAFIATLEMVFTVVLATAFLNESFSFNQWIGAFGILVCVLILSWNSRQNEVK